MRRIDVLDVRDARARRATSLCIFDGVKRALVPQLQRCYNKYTANLFAATRHPVHRRQKTKSFSRRRTAYAWLSLHHAMLQDLPFTEVCSLFPAKNVFCLKLGIAENTVAGDRLGSPSEKWESQNPCWSWDKKSQFKISAGNEIILKPSKIDFNRMNTHDLRHDS